MKNPEMIARKITEQVAESAFGLFKNKKFRNLLDFDSLSQVEQDRIFNEIVLTGLSLAVLMFRSLGEIAQNNAKDFFNELQMETTSYYRSWLKKLGVAEKDARIWKELIGMRCEEYQKDFDQNRADLPDPKKSNPWIAVLAIGGYHHIRRGKVSPDDPLYSMFLNWVKQQAIMISKTTL